MIKEIRKNQSSEEWVLLFTDFNPNEWFFNGSLHFYVLIQKNNKSNFEFPKKIKRMKHVKHVLSI